MHQGTSQRFFFFNRARFRRERADLVPSIWVLMIGRLFQRDTGFQKKKRVRYTENLELPVHGLSAGGFVSFKPSSQLTAQRAHQ